jgi:hypothetical protein
MAERSRLRDMLLSKLPAYSVFQADANTSLKALAANREHSDKETSLADEAGSNA